MRGVCVWLVLAISVRVQAAPVDEAAYRAAVDRLAADRRALAAEYAAATSPITKALVISKGRAVLSSAIRDALMPPWFGTPWDFYGTSEVPGKGVIACGYFVSTILRDAGLRVERIRLAQQASERIVRTVAPRGGIQHARRKSAAFVVDSLRARGDAVYVVGLDNHVGFLVVRGAKVEFCHSSYAGPVAVLCEDPVRSPAFGSALYVTGAVTADETIAKWLEGKGFPTLRG